MKPRIFISYKRVDKKDVFRIKKEIETCIGENCWIDLDGIESDAQFRSVIIHAIRECEVVLFMYSKAHSLITDYEKDWTVRELNFAASKNKRIVFINLDGTPLTDEFSFDYGLKQQVDGRSPEAITRLIRDLRKWLKLLPSGNHDPGKFDIPKDTGCTILVQSGDEVIEKIYSNGEEISNKRIESKTTESGKETVRRKKFSKHKGCVVTVTIIASVFLFVIPSFLWFRSPNFSSEGVPMDSYSPENEFPPVAYRESKGGTPDDEQMVGIDLGLPSGTVWANRNIGADNESDYGGFFNRYGTVFFREGNRDGNVPKEVLEKRATADYRMLLGEGWRMPSTSDFDELLDNCSWRWISHYGHKGYEVKGSNGNKIFLPASGMIYNAELQNKDGCYGTNELGKVLLFGESEIIIKAEDDFDWYNIRLVKRKADSTTE